MKPYKCPVCNGTGKVPNGFYSNIGGKYGVSTSTEPEGCRACNCTGVIWGPDSLCAESDLEISWQGGPPHAIYTWPTPELPNGK